MHESNNHIAWEPIEKERKNLWKRSNLHHFSPISRKVKVAIVDSGFDTTHPYLKKRLDLNEGWNAEGNSGSLEEAVLIDSALGESQEVLSSHGTHIAGITAQVVHPELTIVPIRVGSWDSWVVNPLKRDDLVLINGSYRMRMPFDHAFEYLIKSDIQVINLSWSLSFQDEILIEQLINLAEANKLIVFAAGNEGHTLGDTPNTQALSSLANHPRMLQRLIIVGASIAFKSKEWMAPFSNRPNDESAPFFLWAPGADIVSTTPLTNTPKGLESKSGTSMAAGVVTGILGQILAESPTITIDQARKVLMETASPIYGITQDTLTQIGQGQGTIHAQKALDKAKQQFFDDTHQGFIEYA